MTLNDRQPFQDHAIIWRLMSQKRYEIQVTMKCYVHTPYSKVSFIMVLSDFEWFSQIFNDVKHRAVCLRQLSFLIVYSYHPATQLYLCRRLQTIVCVCVCVFMSYVASIMSLLMQLTCYCCCLCWMLALYSSTHVVYSSSPDNDTQASPSSVSLPPTTLVTEPLVKWCTRV